MSKEAKEGQSLNLRIKDGDQFYANETSIHISPMDIVLDFKCSRDRFEWDFMSKN